MSQNRKVIEYEGVKYCKEEGLWYQMLQIREDKLPDAIKTERQLKFNLLPEIQLDVFKCLDFAQLLSVQQTNVYFKNFIYEHGKVLAMKKFYKLEIVEHKPQPKLYDFDLGDYRFTSNFGMCEQKYKFFKPEPRLYEFELGEELEKKWKDGIKNSIPMFLTMGGGTNIKTAVCEFDHEGKLEKGLT
ncbi:unnamed protein product [Meloidogyne enterolobii]|uniref:Uncharacterized protein n=1 Tax=Meloidogyne enterolobii TaxID=390850 RepID=A0ACB0ZZ83_MELEN